MIVEAFRPEHVLTMRLQPQQQAEGVHADADYLARLVDAGPAATLMHAGKPVASAGVLDYADGSYLWAFLSESAGVHMLAVVRAARRLTQIARPPVYATVDYGFQPGCRLLRLLGFEHIADGVHMSATCDHQHIFLREVDHVRV